MLNHEKLNQEVIDYCINELGYNKDMYTKHESLNNSFKFTMGEFRDRPVFPKNTIMIDINDKRTIVSKVITLNINDKEIICFMNYQNKEITALNEDAVFIDVIKDCVSKIVHTFEYESEAIDSSKKMVFDAMSDQEGDFIPMLNITVKDDEEPSFSYSMLPLQK